MWRIAFVAVLFACRPQFAVDDLAIVQCSEGEACPDGFECQVSAQRCVVKGTLDPEPPALISVAPLDATSLRVSFNEALADDAHDLSHFTIDPALVIRGARREPDGQSITLFTAVQRAGETYVLSAAGVRDIVANEAPVASLTFVGFGTRDPAPPAPREPVEALLVAPAQITFRWTATSGASRYRVQVAADAAFTAPLVDAELEAPQTELSTTALLEPITYWWRVRSDATADAFSSAYPSTRFDVVHDTIFVHCAATDDCLGRTDEEIGSRTRPYRRVQAGIAAAAVLRVPVVAVAARGNDLGYDEQLQLMDGVTVRGGFDATFAAYAPATHQTIIENDALAIITGANLTLTGVDGLTVRGKGAAVPHAFGIMLNNVGTAAIRDCAILPRNAEVDSIGLRILDSGNPGPTGGTGRAASIVIEGNAISSGVTSSLYGAHAAGIEFSRTRALLRNNEIRSLDAIAPPASPYGGFETVAVRAQASVVTLDRNTLSADCPVGAASVRGCTAWTIFSNTAGNYLRLTNNVLFAGTADNNGGVLLTENGTADVINNTFYVVNSATPSWGVNQDVGGTVMLNNLFVISSPALTTENKSAIRDILTSFACRHNVFVDYGCAFDRFPYGGLDCQSTTSPGARCPAAAGNLDLTSAQAGLPGFAMGDFVIGPSAATGIRGGGEDTSAYGVLVDRAGTPRTCAGAGSCYSVGAYEAD